MKPLRCIGHWTGGGPAPNSVELGLYNVLYTQARTTVEGMPVELNLRRLRHGEHEYAAHTRGMNSWSFGFAFCGMAGAIERPRSFGPHPLTSRQVMHGLRDVADRMRGWGMRVSEQTLFHHVEAETLHGVRQPGKWDITVLPFRPDLTPGEVGPWMRDVVAFMLRGPTVYSIPVPFIPRRPPVRPASLAPPWWAQG